MTETASKDAATFASESQVFFKVEVALAV